PARPRCGVRGRVGSSAPGNTLYRPAFRSSDRPTVRPSDQDQLVLWMGGVHLGALRVDVHVDLAAHAEAARQIDPRLDRETHARYERARVFRFEVVDVRPGAVQDAIDRMARAMHEVVGEPGVAD